MKSKFNLISFIGCLLLTGCTTYQGDFDCPPSLGVPCTSSSDIESMVIETACGSDVFFDSKSLQSRKGLCKSSKKARVWLCDSQKYEDCETLYIENEKSDQSFPPLKTIPYYEPPYYEIQCSNLEEN